MNTESENPHLLSSPYRSDQKLKKLNSKDKFILEIEISFLVILRIPKVSWTRPHSEKD